jgi:hypothetical protein
MYDNIIYTTRQYQSLQDECVYNAAFSYLDEYGKEEADLIKWLSRQQIPFIKALDNLQDYLFLYIKKLNPNADL